MAEKKRKKKYRVNKKRVAVLIIVLIAVLAVFVAAVVAVINAITGKAPEPQKPETTKPDYWAEAALEFYGPPGFDVTGEAVNKEYKGKGQQKVKGEKGYPTTFTTADGKVYKEYKQNGITPWADKEYYGGTMDDSGCGLAAMSIILSGYGKDQTPGDLCDRYAPELDYEKMGSEFNKVFEVPSTPFFFDYLSMTEDRIRKHLETDEPAIVCIWGVLGANRWTRSSHFITLLACEGDKVYVSNPNGLPGHSNCSGWYDFDEVVPFISKILYVGDMEYLGV